MADPYAAFSSPASADPYAAFSSPAAPPPERPVGQQIARKVGLGAQGLNDALYGIAMAPADISGWIARQTGLVSPDATPPSRATTNALASVPGAIGLTDPNAPVRVTPETPGEKTVYGPHWYMMTGKVE